MSTVTAAELPPPHVDMLGLGPEDGGAVWLGRPIQGAPPRIGLHHRHAELEANLVLAGTGAYLMDGGRFSLDAGMLVWLPAGRDHCLVERSADWQMHILVWTPALLATLDPAHPLRGGETPPPRRLPQREQRLLSAQMLDIAAHQRTPGFPSGCLWLLHRLWAAWRQAPAAGPAAALHPAVARAAHLLAADGEMSTTELARRVGLGPDRLARLFRQQIGLALPDYRNRRRLDRAVESWSPGLSLMTLALGCGFGSYAQFHRVFVRHLGATPRDWAAAQEGGGGAPVPGRGRDRRHLSPP